MIMYVLVVVGINLHTKFKMPSFTHSKDVWAPKFKYIWVT